MPRRHATREPFLGRPERHCWRGFVTLAQVKRQLPYAFHRYFRGVVWCLITMYRMSNILRQLHSAHRPAGRNRWADVWQGTTTVLELHPTPCFWFTDKVVVPIPAFAVDKELAPLSSPTPFLCAVGVASNIDAAVYPSAVVINQLKVHRSAAQDGPPYTHR
jgi:hypothetical protein